MKTHDIDAVTRELTKGSVPKISQDAWDQLSDGITAVEQSAVPASAEVIPLAGKRGPVRPRIALVAAMTLLIAGVIAATAVNRPDQNQPQALSFTERGDKLIVRVVDPNADPKRYNAEFKKMGLNIKVKAVPVSPPSVGTMISFSAGSSTEMDQLHRLEPGEKCNGTLNASDPGCQGGLELPKNYTGKTEIQFGRKAKPGEMYWHMSSSATEKGESLAGLAIQNRTVAEVLPLIESRGVKVHAYYASSDAPNFDDIGKPPAGWYVHDATPYAPGEVTLYVGPAQDK